MPAATRKRLPKATVQKTLRSYIETVDVPVDQLCTYHKNPRVRPDVEDIKESLEENGQFQPIVVNKRTCTVCGRANEILAGNHTFLAVRELGWPTVGVVYVDIDSKAAARVVSAANRTTDRGSYDSGALKEILELAGTNLGTGFTEQEFTSLTQLSKQMAESTNRAVAEVLHQQRVDDGTEDEDFDELSLALAENGQQEENFGELVISGTAISFAKPQGDDFDDVSDQSAGLVGLKDHIVFETKHPWGVPALRPDMLVDQLPDPLDVWAGSATKDWPVDTWWVYNYGIDSMSGMNDRSKIIMCFYTHDNYFENWFTYPDRQVQKLINLTAGNGTGPMAVSPNCSTWADAPRIHSFMATYQARWMGRYMQEAGVKLIPDVNWRVGDVSSDKQWLQFYTWGIPRNAPYIAMQLTTVDEKNNPKSLLDLYKKEAALIVNECQPQNLIVYSAETGKRWIDELVADGSITCPVVWWPTRIIKLRLKNKAKKANQGTP